MYFKYICSSFQTRIFFNLSQVRKVKTQLSVKQKKRKHLFRPPSRRVQKNKTFHLLLFQCMHVVGVFELFVIYIVLLSLKIIRYVGENPVTRDSVNKKYASFMQTSARKQQKNGNWSSQLKDNLLSQTTVQVELTQLKTQFNNEKNLT